MRIFSRTAFAVLLVIAPFGWPCAGDAAAQGVHAATAVASVSDVRAAVPCGTDPRPSRQVAACDISEPLIVIGFMGGRVHGGNLVHEEALISRDLDRRYPNTVYAITFGNHHEPDALRTVLRILDTGKDGRLSEEEKSAARIVIYGHSWGGSEAVNLADVLDRLGIPVLLTIQVDSIEKSGEDDRAIPPNVREAINFYQTHGWLHGRRTIQAMDPQRTLILGNFESSYKKHPISCAGYSWYARAFMKPHIEIENDGAVWNRIEALIAARAHTSDSADVASFGAKK